MSKLTALAVGNIVVFLIAFAFGSFWLTLIFGLSQWILIILLAIKVDAIDDSFAVGYTELKNEVEELNQKIEKLIGKQDSELNPATEGKTEEINSQTAEMLEVLKSSYRSKVGLYPVQALELDIKAKMEFGNTRSQAIEELFKEKNKKIH